jgi:aspartate aminotransferase
MRDIFAKRREVAVAEFEAIPGVKVPPAKGAFYLFPDFSAYYGSAVEGQAIGGSMDLSNLLLDRVHVAAVPGAAFGADAHLRFSYALDEPRIKEGIGRVRDLLAKAEPQPE